MQIIAGIDIGGTKSAVSFARYADGGIEILDKVKMGDTPVTRIKRQSRLLHKITCIGEAIPVSLVPPTIRGQRILSM